MKEGEEKGVKTVAVNLLQIRLGTLSEKTMELIYASDLDRVLNLTYSIFTIESEQDAIDILTVIN